MSLREELRRRCEETLRAELDAPGVRALRASPLPGAIFGEPARFLFPAPLARRLGERGALRVTIKGAARSDAAPISDALVELAHGAGPLPSHVEIAWTSSR